ncbi:MAG: hypothetical protein LBD27_08305 [Tannerella sp.]|nr:hypothetical protein [Tannerella sp.]
MNRNISFAPVPFPIVAWLRKTGYFNRKNSLFNRGVGICGMIFAEREHPASFARIYNKKQSINKAFPQSFSRGYCRYSETSCDLLNTFITNGDTKKAQRMPKDVSVHMLFPMKISIFYMIGAQTRYFDVPLRNAIHSQANKTVEQCAEISVQQQKTTLQDKKISRRHDKTVACHNKMIAYYGEITAYRDEMTAYHNKMIVLRDKMIVRHNKITAHRDEMAAHYNKMTAHHNKMAAHYNEMATHHDKITAYCDKITVRSSSVARQHVTTSRRQYSASLQGYESWRKTDVISTYI